MKVLFNNRLVLNIISLLILQGSNYIFPLLIFPYFVRVLGANNYGSLVFCIALMQFLNILIDYGFNISGTKEISINKQSSNRVEEIFNTIMSIKIFLTVLVSILFILTVEFIPFFSTNKSIYLLSLLFLLGNCLFPLWLFQGLEKMKYITYINVIAKVISTILIFIFVKDDNDIEKAVFFQSLFYVLPGIYSIYFIKVKLNINFRFTFNKNKIFNELKKGKYYFTTSLWINFYNQGPVILLGFLAGNNATGAFGVGQKIMGAFYGLSQPVTQAIYPYICELFEKNKASFHKFKQKLVIGAFIFSFVVASLLFFLSGLLTEFVTGEVDSNISNLVKLFSIIVIFSIMNTVISRIMYAMNKQKVLNGIYSKAAIIFGLFAIPASILLQELGMTIVVLISEGIIFIMNVKNLLKFGNAHKKINKRSRSFLL